MKMRCWPRTGRPPVDGWNAQMQSNPAVGQRLNAFCTGPREMGVFKDIKKLKQ